MDANPSVASRVLAAFTTGFRAPFAARVRSDKIDKIYTTHPGPWQVRSLISLGPVNMSNRVTREFG